MEERLLDSLAFARFLWQRICTSPQTFWQQEVAPLVRRSDRVAGEIAVLALVASRVRSDNVVGGVDVSVRDVFSVLLPTIRDERRLTLLARFPETVLSLGVPSLIASHLGFTDQRCDVLVAGNLRDFADGRAGELEKTPVHIAHFHWLMNLAGSPGVMPSVMPKQEHSILHRALHPFYMNGSDAYVFTHSLFFVSDFGSAHVHDAFFRTLAEPLDAMLAWGLVDRNLDLLGELLIGVCISGNWAFCRYAHIACAVYFSAWNLVGALPQPGQADDGLANVYHATLIGGLLCAVLLQQDVTLADPAPSDAEPGPPWNVSWNALWSDERLQRCQNRLESLDKVWGDLQNQPGETADCLRSDMQLIDLARRYDLDGLIYHLEQDVSRVAHHTLTFHEGIRLVRRQLRSPECAARYGFRGKGLSVDAVERMLTQFLGKLPADMREEASHVAG
ncbi:MAG: hypothetical protein IPH35_03665 [Rhodoferax sp.]|nr:hypothetical protein [Rhodoferax sp.]